MRKIKLSLVLLGVITFFPTQASENVDWSSECKTTGLVRWTFDFGKASASELKGIAVENPTHILKVSEGGTVFKNEQEDLRSLSLPVRLAKDEVYIHSSEDKVEVSFSNKSFTDTPPNGNYLLMSKGHLAVRTGLEQFKLNYRPELKKILGVRVSNSRSYVHSFECNIVKKDSWNILFTAIKRMADKRLGQLKPHQIRSSNWR